jgi:hypothetical protein
LGVCDSAKTVECMQQVRKSIIERKAVSWSVGPCRNTLADACPLHTKTFIFDCFHRAATTCVDNVLFRRAPTGAAGVVVLWRGGDQLEICVSSPGQRSKNSCPPPAPNPAWSTLGPCHNSVHWPRHVFLILQQPFWRQRCCVDFIEIGQRSTRVPVSKKRNKINPNLQYYYCEKQILRSSHGSFVLIINSKIKLQNIETKKSSCRHGFHWEHRNIACHSRIHTHMSSL